MPKLCSLYCTLHIHQPRFSFSNNKRTASNQSQHQPWSTPPKSGGSHVRTARTVKRKACRRERNRGSLFFLPFFLSFLLASNQFNLRCVRNSRPTTKAKVLLFCSLHRVRCPAFLCLSVSVHPSVRLSIHPSVSQLPVRSQKLSVMKALSKSSSTRSCSNGRIRHRTVYSPTGGSPAPDRATSDWPPCGMCSQKQSPPWQRRFVSCCAPTVLQSYP